MKAGICPTCKRLKILVPVTGRTQSGQSALVVRSHSAELTLERFQSKDRWYAPISTKLCAGSARAPLNVTEVLAALPGDCGAVAPG